MREPARPPAAGRDSGSRPGAPTPPWVKAFAAVVVILLIVIVVVHLTGNGMVGHG
ncbi:MAG: hypothetical protein M3Z65_03505 [Chloroflexota bacterium]|nr:hypothetical protein [Chloroflexota bacterium]